MARDGKPPHFLPAEPAAGWRQGNPEGRREQEIPLQGDGELQGGTGGELGNGEGEGEGPAHVADVHAYPDLPVAADRPRRAGLEHFSTRPAGRLSASQHFSCRHFSFRVCRPWLTG